MYSWSWLLHAIKCSFYATYAAKIPIKLFLRTPKQTGSWAFFDISLLACQKSIFGQSSNCSVEGIAKKARTWISLQYVPFFTFQAETSGDYKRALTALLGSA
ncbi:hypothetical protein A7M48_21770 [Acinetobacter baumannii]|nr:hypothetical protein A7M48_21770 [Acinetobacter baumannii]